MCGQYETWSVGRHGRHEKRRGGKVTEAWQAEGKEAEIEIIDSHLFYWLWSYMIIHLEQVIM